MYFDLFNVSINSVTNQTYDLEDYYNNVLKTMKLPYKYGNFTIDRFSICAANSGCNPKKSSKNGNKGILDKLVLQKTKNNTHETKLAKNSKNYVVVFLFGVVKVGDSLENYHIRIPRSFNVGFRMGLANQKLITYNKNLKANNPPELAKLMTSMKDFVVNLTNKSHAFYKKPAIALLAARGDNLFVDSNNGRTNYKISNFIPLMKRLDTMIKTHDLNYEQTNKKSFGKVSFKSDDEDQPTITISNWGYIDIKGAKTIREIIGVVERFKQTAKKLRDSIVYDHNSVKPKSKKGENIKECDKRTKTPENGLCPINYKPIPNQKINKICCHKMKKTEPNIKMIKEIKDLFKHYNMNIPPQTLKQLDSYLKNSSVPVVYNLNNDLNLPVYNNVKKKMVLKGKAFNCESHKKDSLKTYAKQLGSGIFERGTKSELCKDILKLAKEKKLTIEI